jgi:MFS family permease
VHPYTQPAHTCSHLLLLLLLFAGPLVDRYGGRALLLLSFGSSALCYTLTATATSIHMLFVSRYVG